MAKTPSNKLFHLIKSLSGAEKRYFKVFIGSRDLANNKYLRLFEAIDGQEAFNEDALIKSVYGDSLLESRKYSELKSYLYDLIIRSLQGYDEKSSVDYRLKNLLLGIRTLFKRANYHDCRELLGKAKKLAATYEDFNSLIEILNWEKKIAYAQTDIDFLDKELVRITNEEQLCLEQIQEISIFRNMFYRILVSLRKNMFLKDGQIQQIKDLITHPIMEKGRKPKSWTADVLFHRVYSIYHFSQADYVSFYTYSTVLLKLMESKPEMLNEDVSDYISALNNHFVSCGNLGKIEEVRMTLDKLKQVKSITLDDEIKIHRQYYLAKFRLCINTGEFEEGLTELKRHLIEVEKFNPKLFIKNNFYLQSFCIYFGVGDNQNALNCLNEWLKLSGSVERRDLQSLARILNLIMHYELGNTILLESLLRSTYRFLNKEDRISVLESKILDFIKDASKPHSKKELRQALENLKTDFQALSNSPTYGVLELFDIISWMESKISGRTFAEVVKERYHQEIITKKAG